MGISNQGFTKWEIGSETMLKAIENDWNFIIGDG